MWNNINQHLNKILKTPFKLILLFYFIFSFASCNSKINFPEGGYNYPVDISKIDTNVFSYPKALKANRKDSFHSSYYGYYWYKGFNEPNLSTRPQSQITFRLVYETAFGSTSIFTITPNQILVKQLLRGKFYPENDTMKLDKLERLHFRILENHFPLDGIPADSRWKKPMDSFAIIYPKLLDPVYYRYLLDKSSVMDTIPLQYSIKKIPISYEKFNEIAEQINASGYWQLPFTVKCDGEYLDGYGFSLEANLPERYNCVELSNCPEEAEKFSWACQAIVDACNLENKINLISKPNEGRARINVNHDVELAPIKNNTLNKKKK